jgi:hypothetical protein
MTAPTGDFDNDLTALMSARREERGEIYARLQDYPAEYRERLFTAYDAFVAAPGSAAAKITPNPWE